MPMEKTLNSKVSFHVLGLGKSMDSQCTVLFFFKKKNTNQLFREIENHFRFGLIRVFQILPLKRFIEFSLSYFSQTIPLLFCCTSTSKSVN